MSETDLNVTAHEVPRRADFVRRRLRAIDAFIDLVLEGDPTPTPETVAERAGVSRASVFRYFESLDVLRAETTGRVLERFVDLFELGEPSAVSPADRAADFVDSRLRFHETLHPLGLLQRRHGADPDAAATIDLGRTLLADQVRAYFERDLEPLDDEHREDVVTTIAALTSIESWQQSSHSHGRTSAQTRRAWISAITAVIAGAGSSTGRNLS
ncbi:MAG: TetR/AcrR family transcriptional regulator [Ilumatobacter sp.]|uniref:TetR/AcrR family transcriptional regulator n=1 Tax=Ilumatobacter sp. TaxID=1967498 RepID=UPI00391963BE